MQLEPQVKAKDVSWQSRPAGRLVCFWARGRAVASSGQADVSEWWWGFRSGRTFVPAFSTEGFFCRARMEGDGEDEMLLKETRDAPVCCCCWLMMALSRWQIRYGKSRWTCLSASSDWLSSSRRRSSCGTAAEDIQKIPEQTALIRAGSGVWIDFSSPPRRFRFEEAMRDLKFTERPQCFRILYREQVLRGVDLRE